MKILLTGGGTGGHFYPIIAVAEALSKLAEREKIVTMDLVFMSDSPYDEEALFRYRVRFKRIYAGKVRRYFSLLNISDTFKTIIGFVKSIWYIYLDFPDVVFSKGGYASFPVILASRLFRIPLIIHESDSIPGKVNLWAGKFAKRIAISFGETASYFDKKKLALTGNPVRHEFFTPAKLGAGEFFNLEGGTPVIFIMGGSQGAVKINETVLDILPNLLNDYQIIHQCGLLNISEVKKITEVTIGKSIYKSRYHPFGFLDESGMRMAYAAASIVISRAGSGSIFEIAASGAPSILIPLKGSAQGHQRENAYNYASSGASDVIEEDNLTPHLLASEVRLVLKDEIRLEKMSKAAKEFSRKDAALTIAEEIINLALEHAS